jgi:hypothetical protein
MSVEVGQVGHFMTGNRRDTSLLRTGKTLHYWGKAGHFITEDRGDT